jgi:purine-binding chemotaxis protein CheW
MSETLQDKTALDDRQPDARQRDARQQMESVWRDRATRLSRRPVPERAGQDARPVIVLGIGEERYGIDMPDVAEILPPIRITPVPGAAAVFAGVINVHGEIRPVIDLRQLLGMGTVGDGHPARVILLRSGAREMGLRADTVEQVDWIGARDVEPERNGDAEPSRHVRSKYIGSFAKDMLMLLSTEALFAELDA